MQQQENPFNQLKEEIRESLKSMPPQVRYVTILELGKILSEEIEEAKKDYEAYVKQMENEFSNLLLNVVFAASMRKENNNNDEDQSEV